MPRAQCPICFGELETRDVAPCMHCGAWPSELEHFLHGYSVEGRDGSKTLHRHRYGIFEIFPGMRLTLCDCCFGDLGSFNPAYFGPKAPPLDQRGMSIVRLIWPATLGKDQFCPECNDRLAFLTFVAEARARYA